MTLIGHNQVMNAPIHEVKAKFSAYLALVEQGNHVTILRHDKPVAELRPITPIEAFDPMSEEELDEIDQHPLFPAGEPR